jgi:hypothetical protein
LVVAVVHRALAHPAEPVLLDSRIGCSLQDELPI